MAKGKTATVFFCQNCGYESTKWLGQCPGCREWNTFVEETIDKTVLKNTGTGSRRERREASEPCVLSEIAIREENKTLTGIKELDRVLGGGIVQGSLTLVGGDPGIGKSTLLLQVCHNLSEAGHKVLYISGEESKVQIKMRADRLGTFSEHMLLLCETNLDIIGEEPFGIYVERTAGECQWLCGGMYYGGHQAASDRTAGAGVPQQFRNSQKTDHRYGFQPCKSPDGSAGETFRSAIIFL